MALLNIILRNLMGFDMLIFILAAVNILFIIPKINKYAVKIKQQLSPTVYKPLEALLKLIREDAGDQSIDLHQIRTLKDRQSFYYHLFININAIFPLLGILGTVISLLRVTDLTNSLIVINFTTALTSTLWGLVFAIGFKTVDGVIGAKVEENEADFNLLINRIDHVTKGDVDEA